MDTSAKSFFSTNQQEAIRASIVDAELDTSGEIRVHIEEKCSGDPVQRAVKVFAELKMHKTELRNGVLFYLAVSNRKFAILGDGGINEKVPEGFWDNIKDQMLVQFKVGNFTEGLCEAIKSSGEQLKKYFPYQKGDLNELNDEVSFGK